MTTAYYVAILPGTADPRAGGEVYSCQFNARAIGGGYPTMDMAKTAAQADYNRRILSALTVHEPGEEEVERVARAIYEEDDPWHPAWPWPNLNENQAGAEAYRRYARAAITALREGGRNDG